MANCKCNNSGNGSNCRDDTYTTTKVLQGQCVDGLVANKPDWCCDRDCCPPVPAAMPAQVLPVAHRRADRPHRTDRPCRHRRDWPDWGDRTDRPHRADGCSFTCTTKQAGPRPRLFWRSQRTKCVFFRLLVLRQAEFLH